MKVSLENEIKGNSIGSKYVSILTYNINNNNNHHHNHCLRKFPHSISTLLESN
jgi:hypothetical protein